MQIYSDLDELPKEPLEPVVTMGNFDGVHRGHQTILGRLKEEAKRAAAPTMVITFFPHPRQVLSPDEPFYPLMTIKERCRRLWDLSIDHVLILPFDHDFMELSAREFVEETLWDALKIRGIYVGPDTRFGHDRGGDVRYLESLGRQLGYGVGVVDPVVVEGGRVSSSRVRAAVADGHLDLATKLLGRHHRLAGDVVEGDKRGRELGFPTANIPWDGCVLPPLGVYAAWAYVDEESRRPAVVNIGFRPTFGDDGTVHIEAHLIDFEGDLYGKTLQLALTRRIRDEMVFDGPAPLKVQIKRDVIQARKMLGVKRKKK